jgi:hypothetical protein
MKKSIILIPILLLAIISKALAQKKDSVTIFLEYFDKNGNKYGFIKKFDHVPTSNDSIIFKRACSVQMDKFTDSLRKLERPYKKIRKKRKKN